VISNITTLAHCDAVGWGHPLHHTGIVTRAEQGVFHTMEGNTNDDGHRNGFEACTRRRGYRSKDFVLI
jgi:hypothetical protein